MVNLKITIRLKEDLFFHFGKGESKGIFPKYHQTFVDKY